MYYYTNGAPRTEVHRGIPWNVEPPDPRVATPVCSGVPEHHQATIFVPCEDFQAVDALRPRQECPADAIVV